MTAEDDAPLGVKQVIVMRKDLGMRKGKMIAQGAHASTAWLTARIRGGISCALADLTPAEREWVNGPFTKVCVGVDSEEELIQVHADALGAGLASAMIVDSGLTEFHGAPTRTCVAVGPDWVGLVDEVTGHLKLL